jgi:nucleoid DNA-binding protein
MMIKRDITEEAIHEIWLECNGDIKKSVIREAATYVMSQLRQSFLERKVVRIDGIGTFYITNGRKYLLAKKDRSVIDGLEDTKNID